MEVFLTDLNPFRTTPFSKYKSLANLGPELIKCILPMYFAFEPRVVHQLTQGNKDLDLVYLITFTFLYAAAVWSDYYLPLQPDRNFGLQNRSQIIVLFWSTSCSLIQVSFSRRGQSSSIAGIFSIAAILAIPFWIFWEKPKELEFIKLKESSGKITKWVYQLILYAERSNEKVYCDRLLPMLSEYLHYDGATLEGIFLAKSILTRGTLEII